MQQQSSRRGVEAVVDLVRRRIAQEAPEDLGLFETHAREAVFGRELIAEDVAALAPDALVVEIGAGALLLSAGLASEGFQVVAVEPGGHGFSHLERFGEHTRAVAAEHGWPVEVVDSTAETYDHAGPPAQLAFAINVMEHVDDPARAIDRAVATLAPGASFHVVCPNYRFPYEPHFNSLTLGTHRLTERFLARRWIARADRPELTDPEGTWRSLNWITTTTIRRALRGRRDAVARFDRRGVLLYLERAGGDETFLTRKGKGFTLVTRVARRVGMGVVVRVMPTAVLPVIDCHVVGATDG